jgi:hypothetical protein
MFSKPIMSKALVASLSVTEEAANWLYDTITPVLPFNIGFLQKFEFDMVPAIHQWVLDYCKPFKHFRLGELREEIFHIQMGKNVVSLKHVLDFPETEYFAANLSWSTFDLNELGLFTTIIPIEEPSTEREEYEEIGPFARL